MEAINGKPSGDVVGKMLEGINGKLRKIKQHFNTADLKTILVLLALFYFFTLQMLLWIGKQSSHCCKSV